MSCAATAFVPLDTNKVRSGWQGDPKPQGTYTINTSDWGIPAGVKAVELWHQANWDSPGWGIIKLMGGLNRDQEQDIL